MTVASLRLEASMFPKPKPSLTPNTYEYESSPLVKPTGFREYDARWLLGKRDQPHGRAGAGHGPRHLIRELGVQPGDRHRPRFPLLFGLGQDGADRRPDGRRAARCTTSAWRSRRWPISRSSTLDVPCVAMVTASHNDNGWTGVKMGANRPLTFGPDEMARLKDIVLDGDVRSARAAAPTPSSRISPTATSPT